VVDARYPYEFQGRYIKNAINCFTDTQITKLYKKYFNHKKICFVFHCRFSSYRGQNAAEKFRSLDRKNNEYPFLSFSDLFVIEGVFKRFPSEYPCKCEGEYIKMRDPKFILDGSLFRYHALEHPKTRRIQRCISANPFYKPLQFNEDFPQNFSLSGQQFVLMK
jgi:hypothetical protein